MVKKYSKHRNSKSKRRYNKSKRRYNKSKRKYNRKKQKGGSGSEGSTATAAQLADFYKGSYKYMTEEKEKYMKYLKSETIDKALEAMRANLEVKKQDELYHMMYRTGVSPLKDPAQLLKILSRCISIIKNAILIVNVLPKYFHGNEGVEQKCTAIAANLNKCVTELNEIGKFDGMEFPPLAYEEYPNNFSISDEESYTIEGFKEALSDLGLEISGVLFEFMQHLTLYSYIATDSDGNAFESVRTSASGHVDSIFTVNEKIEELLNDNINHEGDGVQTLLSDNSKYFMPPVVSSSVDDE